MLLKPSVVSVISVLTMLTIISCKPKEKISKQVVVVSDTPMVKQDENTDTFRVVVSFISIGEGTDPEASAKLQAYLDKIGKDFGLHATNIRFAWGREGEIDNCFLLSDFNASQQTAFIKGLRDLFKGNSLVIIEEKVRNKYKK